MNMELKMEYAFTPVDFNHPSVLFRVEDALKGVLGGLFYRPFLDFMKIDGGERIMDFGCGGGTLAKLTARRLNEDGSLTCLDTAEYWLERAKKRLKKFDNMSFVLGDIRDRVIPENSMDIITLTHVLHDIDPRSREATVRSLAGVLSKGGRLYIWEPTRPNHGISIQELNQLMNRAGLNQVRAVLKKSYYIGYFEKMK
jgi:ubiquinone/menaquinone biosynthesis C-methylase UbiE